MEENKALYERNERRKQELKDLLEQAKQQELGEEVKDDEQQI